MYKELTKSIAKNQAIHLKKWVRIWTDIFQRWHTDGQQIHEKVFNITNQEKYKQTTKTDSQWYIIGYNLEIVKSIERIRASLVVQWLRLQAPDAGSLGSILGQGDRSHMSQLKILCAAVKI